MNNLLDLSKNIVLESIAQVMPEAMSHQKITLTDELYHNLYIDSRQFLSIVHHIELRLGHEIDNEVLLDAELITVNDLVQLVVKISSNGIK